MSSILVFDYSDPCEFLAAVFQQKQQKNPGFSLRAWSRQLGFRSPSFLSAILRGDRRLRPAVAAKISQGIPLSKEHAKYFELLVLINAARSIEEKELYARLLEMLRPNLSYVPIKLEQFRFIADWYHLALLEALDLEDFCEDPDFLSDRFGGKISPALIRLALQRLERLKLLVRDRNGKAQRSVLDPKIGDEVASEAIKIHHSQMLTRAGEALYEQALEDRDFRGTTLSIRRDHLPKAKKLIKEFHSQIQKLAVSQRAAHEVYRMNTQLFCLTAKRGSKR